MDIFKKKIFNTFTLVLVFTALVGFIIGMSIDKLDLLSRESPNARETIVSIDDSESYRGLNIKTSIEEEREDSVSIKVNLSLDDNVKIDKVKFEIEYWSVNDLSNKKYTDIKEVSNFPIEFNQNIKGLKSGNDYKYRVIIDGGYANKENNFKTKFAIKEFDVTISNDKIHEIGNSIRPRYSIKYDDSKEIDLTNLKIRYYYSIDSEYEEVFWCDYAGLNTNNDYKRITSLIEGKFVKMDIKTGKADHYLEISFKMGAGKMQKNSKIDVYCRYSKKDWSDYNQTNDYSYCGSKDYVTWDKITMYYKDELIFGKEPIE
ncbi:MAG: cellulose binding domain-containing protein [Clostridiales bacterium]